MKSNKKRSGVSLIIITFSIITLMVFVGFAIDIGYILNAQSELQKALETSCLVGTSEFEAKKDISNNIQIVSNDATSAATATFTAIINKSSIIKNASVPTTTTITDSRAIGMESEAKVNTFFMNLIGINTITIKAQAAAITLPFYLSKQFPLNVTRGSIITEDDTNLKLAIGDNGTGSDQKLNNNINNLYGPPDDKTASLGSYGYVMIRLPVPVYDGVGYDLYIRELGNLEGYIVLAGNDTNPDNPYYTSTNPGAGISWKNISAAGYPVGIAPTTKVGAYLDSITAQNIFYGSGLFDLKKVDLTSAQYLLIIDDGREDGFLYSNPNDPVLLPGEHSTVTPGADIDAVGVFHHSKLIPYSYVKNNKCNEILAKYLGTAVSSTDSDGDGISDLIELTGYNESKTSITSTATTKVYLTNPLRAEDSTNANRLVITKQ